MRVVHTRWWRAAALAGAVLIGATSLAMTTGAAAGTGRAARGADLAGQLRAAVDGQHYEDVLDTTPPTAGAAHRTGAAPEKYDPTAAELAQLARTRSIAAAQPIHQMPNVDAAVIELGADGRPRSAADVLLSPQYPHGISVPLDRNLATDQVRWRWWDDDEWDRNNGKGTRDVLPGRERAPIDFSSPYPASVLKLMVGFGVLRLADQGRVSLDDLYAYQPVTPKASCGAAVTKPIRQFFDEMITVSRNESTCALIKMIHDLRAMDDLNAAFADLGLPTLRITGTNPDNGGTWIGSNMSAIDTARLLLLVNGGPGTLWTAPTGEPVTRDVLSPAARLFFLRTLGDQGHNEMLSTTNWCGRGYPAPGIPQVTPQRWINPQNGTMTVAGAVYGRDVRPCNASAEVTFAHKTGWVDTTGSDAGIVHSLPGQPRRDYIVVVFSNLGTDYIDVNRPADPPGIYPVPYTEKHGKLGRAIDEIMKNYCPSGA
jgi:hypothetical protein